ncbi:BamA/TamA family outer membrane protein [Pseudomonas aeruginosa]
MQRDQIDTGRYTVDEIYDFLDKRKATTSPTSRASIGWSESTLNKGVLATRGHSQSRPWKPPCRAATSSFYKIDYRGQVFAPLTDNYTMRFHRAGPWRWLRIHRAPAVLRELLRRRLQLGAGLQGQHAGASQDAISCADGKTVTRSLALDSKAATPTRTRIPKPSVVTS